MGREICRFAKRRRGMGAGQAASKVRISAECELAKDP